MSLFSMCQSARPRLLLAAVAGPLVLSAAARGATVTWSGSNTTWNQPDTDSFNAQYASGDTAVFAGAGQGTVTIGSGVTPGQVNVTNGSYNFEGPLGGSSTTSGLAKSGTGTLTLSGAANTYQGTTTVSGGVLVLSKGNNVVAVPGNLEIENAAVQFNFPADNQIASTAAVTMSGSTAVFNGTGFVDGGTFPLSLTVDSFTVTGGVVNTNNYQSTTGLTVTNAGSITGGAGNTDFWYGSGGLGSFGSLSLVGMTGTTSPAERAPNTFRMFGNNDTRQTRVTIGSGGLSLDGSNILLGLGAVAGRLGSRLLLNGDVTTAGSSASSIMAPASDDGSFGTRDVALSGSSGTVTRTFTTGGGGANLTVSIPITNGSATTAGITKAGPGTFTLAAANTFNGPTTISAGTLALAASGSFASSPAVTVESGAVLSVVDKTSGFAFLAGQTLAGAGEVALPTSGPGVSLAGTLAPGAGSVGTLAFTGAGTFDIGSATALEFGLGTTLASDLVTVASGTLAIGSGLLNFDDFAFTPLAGFGPGTYTLFSASSITGSLGTTGGSIGSFTGTLEQSGGTINLVVVPEPAGLAVAGFGIGLAVVAAARRRRS